MGRASWKVPYVNYYLFRKFFYKRDEIEYNLLSELDIISESDSDSDSDSDNKLYYLRNSAGILLPCFVGEIFEVYRGKNTTKILIKDNMLYHHTGEFFLSKTTGDSIHDRSKKKKGKSRGRGPARRVVRVVSKKKKRGYIVNPLARRLYYHNGWIDSWFADKKYYSVTLHNVLSLRKFIYGFFKRKRIKQSGLLLSNMEFTKGLNYDKMSIHIYDGPFQEYIINDFKKTIRKGLFLKGFEERLIIYTGVMLQVLKKQAFLLKKMKIKILNNKKVFEDNLKSLLLLNFKNKMKALLVKLSLSRIGSKMSLKNFFFLFYWKNFILKQRYVRMVSYLKITMDKFSLKKLNITFAFLGNEGVTAEMLCRFIAIKLRDKYTVNELFRPLKRELNIVKKFDRFFYGFKIKLSGRFARRDRSKFYTLYEPTLPLSTTVAPIDYYNSTAVLKNSICSIKVWLHRQPFSKNASRFNVIGLEGENYDSNLYYFKQKEKKIFVDLSLINKNKKIEARYLKLCEKLSLNLKKQGLLESLVYYQHVLKKKEDSRLRYIEESKKFTLDELDALTRYKRVSLKRVSRSYFLIDSDNNLDRIERLLKIKKLKIYLRKKLNEKKS